ncbi:MAK10-like protein [Tanacetum coccineum]
MLIPRTWERTRLHLFQFSLRDQASNWLERLPAGSITTWEDLTTRFLAQFFPPGRTAKLRNDILMFQQHHGESLSEAWTRFKDLLQKVPHHGIDLWLQDLALYDNESWNDPRDFAKPVKVIALPQDVPSTSDRRLIELKNQVQRLMEAHLSPTQPTQVNKITTLCEDLEQAFVEYASSRTDEVGDARFSNFEADFKQQQSEMSNKIDTVLKAITDRIVGALPSDTVKNPKLSTSLVLFARSYPNMNPLILMIEDLDYLVIPDVRSYIVVLMGYSYHLKEFNCSAQVSQRQMPMWNSLKEVLYFFGLFSSVKGYLGGILLHRSSIYNSARLSNKLGNVTPSVFKFGTFHPPRVYGHPMSIWLPKFQNTWGKRYYDVIRTSQDKEDPSWSTSIKTRRQRRHLQHWKRLECHYIMLYLYLLGTFGPHDTHYCIEDPKQAFVEYASSRTDEAGDARLSKFEADFKQQQSEMSNKIDTVLKAIADRIAVALPSDTVKNPKLSVSPKKSDSYDEKEKENEDEEKDSPENIHVNPSTPHDPSVLFIAEKVLKFNLFFESLRLVPQSSNIEVVCTKGDDGEVMFIELIRKNDDSSKGEPKVEGSKITEGVGAEYFDIFPTSSELAYHKVERSIFKWDLQVVSELVEKL